MRTVLLRSGALRVAVVVLSTLAAAAMLVAPAGAAQVEAGSAISITQTPSGSDDPCVPAPLGLTYTTDNTPESFSLRVVAAADPCSPIEAKAVVYELPATGGQWPQTLGEVVPFTISEAGTTEILFTKGCDPVQFDVLTGATPEVISPLGEWHGPLLFPFDTATSLQYFGNPDDPSCVDTTTTTPTTEPEIEGVTTVPESTSTSEPEVAGETTVPVDGTGTGSGGPQVEPTQLALTGRGSVPGALTGLALVAAGALVLVAARRRDAESA